MKGFSITAFDFTFKTLSCKVIGSVNDGKGIVPIFRVLDYSGVTLHHVLMSQPSSAFSATAISPLTGESFHVTLPLHGLLNFQLSTSLQFYKNTTRGNIKSGM